MKRSLLTVAFLGAIFLLQPLFAQVSIIKKPSNPYRHTLENLWDVNVTSQVSSNVYLQVKIYRGSQLVITAQSSNTVLKAGLNSYSRITLQTKQSVFHSSPVRNWYQSNLSLPPGKYQACYQLVCADANCDGGKIGADEVTCQEFKLESPTPLLLNTPSNEAVIDDQTPLLTWIPPTPVSSDVTYHLTLVKMNKGQSREDAVLRNRPVLEKTGIHNVLLQYPSDLPELEKGEHYSWTVKAELMGQEIARAEVWEFEIAKDSIKKKPEVFNYIKIRELTPSDEIIVQNVLRLDYHEDAERSGELTIRLLSSSDKLKGTYTEKITFGENLLNIDISRAGLKSGEIYTAEIIGPSGKAYRLNFTYMHSY